MQSFVKEIASSIAKDILASGAGKTPSPMSLNDNDTVAWSGVVSVDLIPEQNHVSFIIVPKQITSPGLKQDHKKRNELFTEIDSVLDTVKSKIVNKEISVNDPLIYRTDNGYWVEVNLLPSDYMLIKVTKSDDYRQSEPVVEQQDTIPPEATTEDQYNDPSLRDIAHNRLLDEGFTDEEIDEKDLRHAIDLILQEK